MEICQVAIACVGVWVNAIVNVRQLQALRSLTNLTENNPNGN
ncbi:MULTISPECIES: hypothetical protein [Nostocales]|nr:MULTISPECIES: hypothetical protein [Nostocales]